MKMNIRVALLAAAGLTLTGHFASAQIAPSPPAPDLYGSGALHGRLSERVVRDFDLDKDGKITRAEANKAISLRFARASGGAAFVTPSQLAKAHEDMLRAYSTRQFRRLDWDGNGLLSLDEYRGPLRARFAKMDRETTGAVACKRPSRHGHGRYHGRLSRFCQDADINRDGKVTRTEFDKVVGQQYERASEAGKGMGPEAFYRLERTRFEQMEGRRFKRLDKNKDGKLSEAEFGAPGQRLFDRLDKNHDGVIAGDELSKRHHGTHRRSKGKPGNVRSR